VVEEAAVVEGAGGCVAVDVDVTGGDVEDVPLEPLGPLLEQLTTAVHAAIAETIPRIPTVAP